MWSEKKTENVGSERNRFIFVDLQKQVYCHHTVQFELLFLQSKTQNKKENQPRPIFY